jgi:FkbM family methyltransferase
MIQQRSSLPTVQQKMLLLCLIVNMIMILTTTVLNTYNSNNSGLLLQQSVFVFVSAQQSHSLIRKIKARHPGYEPNVVIDIGANKGYYTKAIRELFPQTKIIMVEASDQHTTKLQNFTKYDNGLSEVYINVLSNADNDIVKFYDSPGANTGNSMFREHSKHFVNLQPLEKRTKTLNTLISQSQLLDPSNTIDILKADVQGAELLVFEGASSILQQVTFVQFEASTIEWNEGGSCFHDVDTLLRSYGFYLYDIGDFFYNTPAFKTTGLGQFDIVYIKPTSSRLPESMKQLNGKFCGSNYRPQDPIGPNGYIFSSRDTTSIDDTNNGKKSSSSRDDDDINTYLGFLYGVTFSAMCYVFLSSSKINTLLKHSFDNKAKLRD